MVNMKNPLKQSLLNILRSSEFEISIRKAGKFRFPSNYMFGRHNHQEFEMNYVTSGNCVMEIDGMLFMLKSGDLVLVSPGVAHYFMVGAQRGCSITQLEYKIALPECVDEPFRFMRGQEASSSTTVIPLKTSWKASAGITEREKTKTTPTLR